jgi:phosphohistidine phosphatase SixA
VFALLFAPARAAPPDDAALWQLLKAGKHVVLLRHAATVPGVGDPPNFDLANCATQRNLSDAGREDARALGAAFRRHGVKVDKVLSSRWCRSLDTARLAFGRVEPAPMIDSIFSDDAATGARKEAEVRSYVAANLGPGNLVLVTHDVNIRALVGEYVTQGEMVVATPRADGALDVVGRLRVPARAGH